MRTRSRARSDAKGAIFVSILQPLVDSGHVEVKDLGVLSQVSKEVNQASMEDSIWAYFCQREYHCTNCYSKAFREKKGYRWLYKYWSTPIVKRHLPPNTLGLPSCPVDKMNFFIQVKYDGASLYARRVTAEKLSHLLSKGKVGINLAGNPLVLGKAHWRSTRNRPVTASGFSVFCENFDESKLRTTIHVSNRSSKETVRCCIYSSKERKPTRRARLRVHPDIQEDEVMSSDTKFDLSKDQTSGVLSYQQWRGSRVRLPLNHSRNAEAIVSRFPHHVEFFVDFCVGVVNEDQYAICGVNIVAAYICSDRLQLRQFNSDAEKERSGVTLLHYLSELQGYSQVELISHN